MFKNAVILFAAAIFVAGCASEKPLPPDWQAKPAVSATQPNKINVPPPVKTNLPPAKPIAPVTTWIPLAQWAAQHHLGKPRRIADSPVATYSISSTNGTMTLEIGSREASWNGIQVALGFAPELIDGEISLYGVDLQKNLQPLLCAPAISFPQSNRVIVIDPGHGGSNVGTHSALDGRFEKEFTLDVALRLKPLLETNGWTVFLTRSTDEDFANSNRVTFADEHHADVFISLHFNATATRDPNTGGIETYCVTPRGMPSTMTRGYSDPWLANLPANEFDEPSLQLAVKIQSALVRATGLEDRGVCRARFMTVLQGQHRPAILVEAGYLSNPEEAKKIESADYRQKISETIAEALK
ncbi:MAG TPA: N-acetylmuramoyl-L-alanine amidase [Verrucomicrobiae bacterium]|nr:N-acetylmuramoyl-L-alanine amidase [Verrucomicrobiae bacterium]